MRFEVTQEDIDNGTQGNCCYCAVALALQRNYPDCSVSVGACSLYIGCRSFPMPDEVCKFVIDFDLNKSLVKPIVVEIYE